MKYPMKCANPKCREDLLPWKESGVYCGWKRQARTGRWLCPSCRYLSKWAFGTGAALAGVVWFIVKLVVKL
jgi:hypothetical protein